MRPLLPNQSTWGKAVIQSPDLEREKEPKGHMQNTLLIAFRIMSLVAALLFPVLLFIKFL